MRRARRGSAAAVVTAGALGPGGDADRLLLAHMVRNLGLRSAGVMMAILFGFGAGLRQRGQRDEGQGGRRGDDIARFRVCFSIVTLGRRDVGL